MSQRYIRIREAAGLFGISVSTLRAWIRKYGVPHYRVGGVLLFEAEELRQFVDAHRVQDMIKGRAEERCWH